MGTVCGCVAAHHACVRAEKEGRGGMVQDGTGMDGYIGDLPKDEM